MNLYSSDRGMRVPLFKVLVIFAVTFFVYNDFNIRMIIGYMILLASTIGYLVFSNTIICIDRVKIAYLLLSVVISALVIIGNHDESIMTFVLAIDLCMLATFVGDIQPCEFRSTIKLLMMVSVLMSLYVILVKLNPAIYTSTISKIISEKSNITNTKQLRDGYGITLGGNVVFIDYVLTLSGLIIANTIMVYKGALKHKWIYWGCLSICFIGMLFENRKSELLAFLIGLLFCFRANVRISSAKERVKLKKTVLLLIIFASTCLLYFASKGYLNRYLVFFERLLNNARNKDTKIDVTSGRTLIWALAFNLFLENPILGIGWGHFEDYVSAIDSNLSNVHNNYLQLLCETGIVGFLLVIIPMILLLINTIKYRKKLTDKNLDRKQLSLVANTTSYGLQVSFLVLSFLDPCWYKMSFWPFFAIAIMMANATSLDEK